MSKKRLFYLDFVRAIAAISIVITHFNARYLYLNPPMPEKAVITTTVSNIYIGGWGVSLFFIISGAALMYVYGENCDVKKFYKKRFISIYPMFWMAYVVAFLYLFYTNKTIPGEGTPKINMIFSVLGFDGLLAENFAMFYVLGEWFLGAIILLYLIFPILRELVLKKPVITVIGVLTIYFLIVFFYDGNFNSAKIIFTRLPEIMFGMYFVKWGRKVNWKFAVLSVMILILNSIIKPEWSVNLQTTYVGIASFIVLVYLSYYLQNVVVKKICNTISKYSYSIFLVHHVIIAKMMSTFDLVSISIVDSYVLFVSICFVIALFSWLLYNFHAYVMKQVALMLPKS